jgi:hypothetical protein
MIASVYRERNFSKSRCSESAPPHRHNPREGLSSIRNGFILRPFPTYTDGEWERARDCFGSGNFCEFWRGGARATTVALLSPYPLTSLPQQLLCFTIQSRLIAPSPAARSLTCGMYLRRLSRKSYEDRWLWREKEKKCKQIGGS